MSTKKSSFSINSKDVRPLITSTLGLILTRHKHNYSAKLQELSKHTEKGSRREILECLRDITQLYNVTAQEFDNVAGLILELEDFSPADTEVLKDLPDLKKNSLGVGGGSE